MNTSSNLKTFEICPGVEKLPSAIVFIDAEGNVLFCTEEALRLFHVSLDLNKQTLRLGDVISCRHRSEDPFGCGNSQSCPGCPFFQAIQKGLAASRDVYRKEGQAGVERDIPPHNLWFRYVAKWIDSGNQWVFAISFEDISSLKEKERELDVRRAHFEHLFQHAPLAIALLDGEDRFLDCNLQFTKLFQYTIEEIKGRFINDCIVPADLVHEASSYSQEVMEGHLIMKETVRKRKDGSLFPVSIVGAPIQIGAQVFIYAIYQDISLQKEMERKIWSLLKEKELLLKETHHRIKNNMSLIISLLSLQRGTLKEPEALSALQEIEGRIRSMELLYEKLYRSEHRQAYSLKDYLEPLAREILSLYPRGPAIHARLSIPPLMADQKTLSSLGIILNELLTNSMKYAFPSREEGTIILSIEKRENALHLTYRDDGVGLPEGFSLEQTDRFGLQLVTLLTEQLGGSLRIDNQRGTSFVIEIPYLTPSI